MRNNRPKPTVWMWIAILGCIVVIAAGALLIRNTFVGMERAEAAYELTEGGYERVYGSR